jgi:DNA-binding transcriptional LysR family regulator
MSEIAPLLVVASTDLVAALSRQVAEPFARILPLRLFDPPLRLRVSRIGMVWYDSLHEDPAHRWLRRIVAEVARSDDATVPRTSQPAAPVPAGGVLP